MPSVQDAQTQYRLYNEAYFDALLPPAIEIRFIRGLKDDKGKDLHGQTSKPEDVYLIELNAGMAADLYRLTLCHEMVHLKLHNMGLRCWRSHKSKAWNAEVSRLSSLGFLREIF